MGLRSIFYAVHGCGAVGLAVADSNTRKFSEAVFCHAGTAIPVPIDQGLSTSTRWCRFETKPQWERRFRSAFASARSPGFSPRASIRHASETPRCPLSSNARE